MLKQPRRKLFLVLFAFLLSPILILSQGFDCPELVSKALEALKVSCNELGRNQVCYGHEQVQASFINEVEADFFTTPSSTAPVADFSSIRTSPLNLEAGTWGLAQMNIQAKLPNTLPGQNITFILLGDVELENAVAPDEAFKPSDGIELRVAVPAGATLRSGAGNSFNALGSLAEGESLVADGLSEDGEWLRTVYEDAIAWVERSLVADNGTVSSLPTLSSEQYMAMQAFYLRTGLGEETCDKPDNLLLVQGPKNITVELSVNGAHIKLGSTGALRVIEEGEQSFLEVTVMDGVFEVDGITIEAGEKSVVCLGDEESRGADGEANDLVATCEPSAPEAIAPNEFDSSACGLSDIPPEVLNYALESCERSHTIQVGETLGRIAEQYCSTLAELMALNNISDANLIVVGQVLVLPPANCEPASPTPSPTSNPTTAQANNQTRHTIQVGETLGRIAEQYCSTVAEIMALNNLSDANLIVVGQVLVIPIVSCDRPSPTPRSNTTVQTNTQAPVSASQEVTVTPRGFLCELFAVHEVPFTQAGDFTISWTTDLFKGEIPLSGDMKVRLTLTDAGNILRTWETSSGTSYTLPGQEFPSQGVLYIEIFANGNWCRPSTAASFDFTPFTLTAYCRIENSSPTVGLVYSNLDSFPISVTIYSDAYASGSYTWTDNSPSGSQSWPYEADKLVNSVVINANGVDYSLTGCPSSLSYPP